jgi:hypothetical protein
MTRRLVLAVGLAIGLGFSAPASRAGNRGGAAQLAPRLTSQELWRLSNDSSEPGGYFRSDNLTSNEQLFEEVIPDLVGRIKPGGVYLGVGPEQNFTYMAAVRPALAIIVDIRRGNLLLQFMYKALFELARDRVELVSMLFAKPRPGALNSSATAAELFGAFERVRSSDALYRQTLLAIDDRLTKVDQLPLSPDDLRGIESIYQAFYRNGFAVRFSPTYEDLMTATDASGMERSYLSTEARFAVMKDLESKNLVVPVVGDFGGPKAIRAIGAYLRAHGATVSAFYLSNVEQYLVQDGKWTAFCRNVATLPLDGTSTFIRSSSRDRRGGGFGFVSSLGAMASEVSDCN